MNQPKNPLKRLDTLRRRWAGRGRARAHPISVDETQHLSKQATEAPRQSHFRRSRRLPALLVGGILGAAVALSVPALASDLHAPRTNTNAVSGTSTHVQSLPTRHGTRVGHGKTGTCHAPAPPARPRPGNAPSGPQPAVRPDGPAAAKPHHPGVGAHPAAPTSGPARSDEPVLPVKPPCPPPQPGNSSRPAPATNEPGEPGCARPHTPPPSSDNKRAPRTAPRPTAAQQPTVPQPSGS